MALEYGQPSMLLHGLALIVLCLFFLSSGVKGQSDVIPQDAVIILNDENQTQTENQTQNANQTDSAIGAMFNTLLQNGLMDNVIKLVMSNLTESLETLSNQTRAISPLCLSHITLAYQGLTRSEQWAMRMIDAIGKPKSGLLNGNFFWPGSFDECLGVVAPVVLEGTSHQMTPFKGQYCVANMVLAKPTTALPTGFPLQLGVCVPSTCSSTDVSALIDIGITAVPLIGGGPPTTAECYEPALDLDNTAIAVIIVCCVFGAIMLLGTMYDVLFIQLKTSSQGETTDTADLKQNVEAQAKGRQPGILGKVLLSFSVYTNGSKILNTRQPSGSLSAVNGVRFLSMSWVILGHSYGFIFTFTDNMATFYAESFKDVSFQAIANATLSVDSFFVLSGLLVSYLTLKQLKKVGGAKKFPWGMFYFHRFWRLTPPYMLTIMVYFPLYKYLGSGPFWGPPGIQEEMCRDLWWRNILYINNLFEDHKGCMGWTWYLANDMQFYVLSPLILVPLYYSPLIGGIVGLVLIGISATSAGILSADKHLPPTFLLDPNSDYMIAIYNKPYTRIGAYVVGVLAGYILYRTKCKLRLPKLVSLVLWCLATAMAMSCLYGIYRIGEANVTNTLSVEVVALYNALSRIAWSVAVAWVIVACATGNGGFVNTLLSWSPFVPLGRLTYCAYLIHPVIIYWYNQNLKVLPDSKHLVFIYLYIGNLMVSYGVAFLLSLTFESPMMGLEKALIRSRNSKS